MRGTSLEADDHIRDTSFMADDSVRDSSLMADEMIVCKLPGSWLMSVILVAVVNEQLLPSSNLTCHVVQRNEDDLGPSW